MSIVHKVYLLKCQGIYKVGYAKNLKSRIGTIQTSNPFPVELVDSFPSEFPVIDEKNIHDKLSKYLVQGEWFKIPKHMIENRKEWFCPSPKLYQIAPTVGDSYIEVGKFAASFFSKKTFKWLAGIESDVDANILSSYLATADDPDRIFQHAVERSYEAYLRSGLTHEQSVAKIKKLIDQEIESHQQDTAAKVRKALD